MWRSAGREPMGPRLIATGMRPLLPPFALHRNQLPTAFAVCVSGTKDTLPTSLTWKHFVSAIVYLDPLNFRLDHSSKSLIFYFTRRSHLPDSKTSTLGNIYVFDQGDSASVNSTNFWGTPVPIGTELICFPERGLSEVSISRGIWTPFTWRTNSFSSNHDLNNHARSKKEGRSDPWERETERKGKKVRKGERDRGIPGA